MKIEQFAAFIQHRYQDDLQEENKRYSRYLMMDSLADKIFCIEKRPGSIKAYSDATKSIALVIHKIHCAFNFGYLALKDDAIGEEDDKITLYTEIAEYMDLVAAGIDSFVATHPIKAIEEGGAGDE